MVWPLASLLLGLLVPAARAADQIDVSDTGRMLRAPDATDAPPAEDARPTLDPWAWRGRLQDLHIVSMMWSNADGVAVLEDREGNRIFVYPGAKLGERAAEVVRIGVGRIELVDTADNTGMGRTWCRIVMEEVTERVEVPAEREGDPPTVELHEATRVRVVECRMDHEHLDLPAQPAWAK
ncbi:MAG: hypothetical protein H6742_04750 [Alphaproteobacteria bacterium]|nr:hypothetical protein [Alphaproteobacteria bacterium]